MRTVNVTEQPISLTYYNRDGNKQNLGEILHERYGNDDKVEVSRIGFMPTTDSEFVGRKKEDPIYPLGVGKSLSVFNPADIQKQFMDCGWKTTNVIGGFGGSQLFIQMQHESKWFKDPFQSYDKKFWNKEDEGMFVGIQLAFKYRVGHMGLSISNGWVRQVCWNGLVAVVYGSLGMFAHGSTWDNKFYEEKVQPILKVDTIDQGKLVATSTNAKMIGDFLNKHWSDDRPDYSPALNTFIENSYPVLFSDGPNSLGQKYLRNLKYDIDALSEQGDITTLGMLQILTNTVNSQNRSQANNRRGQFNTVAQTDLFIKSFQQLAGMFEIAQEIGGFQNVMG